MKNLTKHLLEYTVLDLCDETYYDNLGFKAYELFEEKNGARVFTIACINARQNENGETYSYVLEDYKCFAVSSFDMNMTVQQIADLSYERNAPVMATITEYQEKCVIIASCQHPWVDWFASIFIKGYEGLCESLTPIIMPMLIDCNTKGHNL